MARANLTKVAAKIYLSFSFDWLVIGKTSYYDQLIEFIFAPSQSWVMYCVFRNSDNI